MLTLLDPHTPTALGPCQDTAIKHEVMGPWHIRTWGSKQETTCTYSGLAVRGKSSLPRGSGNSADFAATLMFGRLEEWIVLLGFRFEIWSIFFMGNVISGSVEIFE